MSSMFGGNTAQGQSQPPGAGLFGGSTTTTAAPASTSIFGGAAPSAAPTRGSLFGGNTAPVSNALSGSTLFGGSTANPANTANTTSSLFQPPQQQQQQQQQQNQGNTNTEAAQMAFMLQSGLSGSHFGALGQAAQQELARQRLLQSNIHAMPNEKSIPAQLQTLLRKWDPSSQDTVMQKYLYNAVNTAYAPFYYRNVDEDEREWEEALAKKPPTVENKEGENVSFIPVLVRGFRALGDRVEYQAKTVNEMRARLHEMNNSLDAVMAKHQQSLTVRLETAKRQHAALSQRTLRLAVKAQQLRQRGYALDAAEESLRKSLLQLEGQVFDPAFTAREEEIWARMVVLRERARWLEEEGKRLGGQVADGEKNGVPEDVINKTKTILRNYEGQIAHLGKELKDVKGEFEDWENSHGSTRR